MASDGGWADERARTAAAVGSGAQGRSQERVGPRAGGDRAYGDAAEDPARRGGGRSRRRGIMPVAISLVVLAGFAGAVWYAYNQGLEQGGHREIPLIEAEQAPVKVKPDDPGGLQVPNQDKLVLNQGDSGGEQVQVERLLPEPETPQPPEPADAAAEAGTTADPTGPPATGQAPSGETASGATVAPQVAEGPASEAAAGDGGTSGSRPAVEAPAPGQGTSQGASPGASPGTGQAAQPTQTAQAELLESGAVVIQLASVGSSEAAEQEWLRLQKAFPELLGDMVLAVQEVTVNGKQYHRMQTGPFPNRTTAEDMCAQLKAKKQACLVTRR